MAGEELEVLPPIINVGALVAALDERGHRCGRARAGGLPQISKA